MKPTLDNVNDLFSSRQVNTDSSPRNFKSRFADSRQPSLTNLSHHGLGLEDHVTTPSYSDQFETPSRAISRVSSCRLSNVDLSETSSVRTGTPPPPVNSVNVSLNRDICSQSTSCAQLINLAVSKGHIFNAVNWATCLHRLAKLFPTEAKNHRSTVVRFLSQAHEVLMSQSEGSKFQPQHLATLLWAMAKLSIIDSAFVEDLVQRSMDVYESLKAQDMANIAWSLAKMGITHLRMFNIICNRISDRTGIIKQFKPMEIASTTWAFGTVGAKGMGVGDISVVIESLVSECLERDLREFSPQALANVLWALAKLAYPHERLFSAFGNHVLDSHRLREFKPQEIANVVWAMQCVKLVHSRLYSEIVSGKSINWSVFDPHALATVCGAMMNLVDLNFALIIANRVIASKIKNGFSIGHCGVLLSELSPHLSNPTVATAASMLTEKLLSDLAPGTCVDIHTVRGLMATLPDSTKVMDQISRCSFVEAEYGSSFQLVNIHYCLCKLSAYPSDGAAAEIEKKISSLAVSIGFTVSSVPMSFVTVVVSTVAKHGMITDELVTAIELFLGHSDLMNAKIDDTIPLLLVLSGALGKHQRALAICRLLAASSIEKLRHGQADLVLVGDVVTAVNRIDYAVGNANPDEVALAVMAASISDAMFIRSVEFGGNTEALTRVVYGISEFVSRHPKCSLDSHVRSLTQVGMTIAQNAQSLASSFSLGGIARLIAACYSLDMETGYKALISLCMNQGSLLTQCMQSGPGGLKLLRENLESLSLFCKVVAAHVVSGNVPGSWVQPGSGLAQKDNDDVFSLEGALSLSVALGNVGAVEAQKDIIGHWVLPLMTKSVAGGASSIDVNNPTGFVGSLLASPQLGATREDRLRSYSDLLSQCIPNQGFGDI